MRERSYFGIAIFASISTALICLSIAVAFYFWNENRQLKELLRTQIVRQTESGTAATLQRSCGYNLRMIDGAIQLWAHEKHKAQKDSPTKDDLREYLIKYIPNGWPTCPAGGEYTFSTVDTEPRCSIPEHTLPH